MTLRLGADQVAEAARLLRAGELVAFPTETVYGLGADARNGRAVAAVFEAKGRPHFNPLICHFPDAEAAFAEVLADDRNWFRQNPDQVVRLRPVMPGEEVAQEALGMTMPVLAPPGYCWSDAGSWVGVVHVQRASGDPCRDGSGGRLRFRIPPVPPCARQWMAEALVAYADHVIEEINDGRRPMVGIHAPAEAGI